MKCSKLVPFGSSPRMRGTRDMHPPITPSVRIIPAHAGNSRLPMTTHDWKTGSSPRMRGTLVLAPARDRYFRIIPAHAGNSIAVIASSSVMPGSSPRMRGTLVADIGRAPPHRIIPAHAGNSFPRAQRHTLPPDHPRACGELRSLASSSATSDGSSPRMRGTPTRPRSQRQSWADHPRACGELRSAISTPQWMHGSSPRMRGTRESCRYPATWWRIIPAHAGNSFAPLVVVIEQPDHPRACGELERRRIFDGEDVGSSPRMRGTRRRWLGSR